MTLTDFRRAYNYAVEHGKHPYGGYIYDDGDRAWSLFYNGKFLYLTYVDPAEGGYHLHDFRSDEGMTVLEERVGAFWKVVEKKA